MSVTMFTYHEILDPEMMAAGPPPELAVAFEERGHEFSETWYGTEDMSQMLLVAEFGDASDFVAHTEILFEHGFAEMAGTAFNLHAMVAGDLDDAAHAVIAKYDFMTAMAPVPEMDR